MRWERRTESMQERGGTEAERYRKARTRETATVSKEKCHL